MKEEPEANITISGTAKITVRGPDGQIKHVEEMEVKTE